MSSSKENANAPKTSPWSWTLPAIQSARDQLRALRKTGGAFSATDIHGKEQTCTIQKDTEPVPESETTETTVLRFLPVQLCGRPGLPQPHSDLPGGANCPIWVQKLGRAQDCRATTHIAEQAYQGNLIGAGKLSRTFQLVLAYLDDHLHEAAEITNVVCFGITDDEHRDIMEHGGARERFRGRPYMRYLLCSYIAKALRVRLRNITGDPGRELKMVIQGHVRCKQEERLLGIGFRPALASTDAGEALLAKEYETGMSPAGYPAQVLDDAGGLLEINKDSFIISFDERIPVRQIAAQVLARDDGPAGMLCLAIIDDGADAGYQNSDGRSHDLSSPELVKWREGCLESLVLPDEEPNISGEDRELFKHMKVYLKRKQNE